MSTLYRDLHSLPRPCMTEYDINATVRGQRRGHLKGVGRQLTRMSSGASSAAAGSSTSTPGRP